VRRFPVVVLALVAMTVAAGTQASARPVSDVPPGAIATVAGESIPRTLFDQLMRRIRRSYQLQRRTFPAAGTAASRKVRDDAVALLVWRVVVRQAATELGVRVPESVVEARLGQVREQWGGPASFQAVLRRLGLTETLLRDEIRTRMLLEAVRDSFWAATTVSDEEVASHYQRNLRDYVVPQNRDVRHILVRTRSRAGRLRAQIRAGASFGVLARRHSLDRATRNAGGALSVYRGRGDRAFERAAFALRTRQVSAPVRSRGGWHLIQALSAIRPAVTLPLADVSGSIRELVRLAKANAQMDAWVKDVKAAWTEKTLYAPGFEPGGA
jgi:parvulin-like peptidyl-prolyl isomerase